MRSPKLSELPLPPYGKIGWPWTEEAPQLPETMSDGSPWPRVSIVTPSYNQAQFLEETIRSVLLQGYPDLEYFVMDGGSTDESAQIIQKYEPWLAGWVSEKDNGQADAINKGVAQSEGEIIGWLNSDDLYCSDAIRIVVNYFNAHPEVDMIYGSIDRVDSNGRFIRQVVPLDYSFKKLLSNQLVIPQPATFFRRNCFENVGGLDASFFHAMDFNLWVKIGMNYSTHRVEHVLARFRTHADAKSVAYSYTVGPELLKTLDWAFSQPDLPMGIQAERKEIYSGAFVVAGTGYYASLRLSQARQFFYKAIKLYPSQIWKSRVILLMLRTLLGKQIISFFRTWKQK